MTMPADPPLDSELQRELEGFADNRLNLLAKLRQRSVQEMIAALREHEPPSAPYVVEFDPTTACNLACPECISGTLLNQGGMPRVTALEIIEDLAALGTRAIIFIGGGEPMAHPAFSDLVRRSHDLGLKVGITTNGTLISRHHQAIAACAAWTRVSLDAARDATFHIFRPSHGNRLTLSSILRQMESLARDKTGQLGYSFLLLKRGESTNLEEILEAALIARDIGCDYLEVKPSMNADHSLVRWTGEELARIVEQLEAARSLETDEFSVLAPISLFRVLNSVDTLEQPKEYHWCPAAHYRTVITPSGCYVCPYHRGNGAKRYGDARQRPFREIWNSAEFRAALRDTDPAVDCGFHCIRHGQNQHVINLTAVLDQAEDTKVDDYDPFI